ncbi:epoxide hydrolase family protein [Pseudonocardia abyssalis]|uniref:Epoxide hydrolase n=1 Tax=Pseudonocardia abyssalis TaxID=2792008 RepID=A0ABS6UV73_9PSEU|nr:epoxide hydrolase family protein [Pseudonocardia abyssalis]MBW0118774.1 epoxide hydrolase [Pseudonocardia abyssalis]MBW0136165.1 epoxide hydrolase [Pseudonocardia abyssalis]
MREFHVDIPQADLDDLRDRIARTRWPEASTVDGWTQGVPLDYARELVEHWGGAYDWRRCEAELNALPQFRTPLDGGGDDSVQVHFLHVRSRHQNAMPLLLTHGWPGSVIEFLDVIDDLVDPPDPRDAFHLVIPSLPGYGFSDKPSTSGWGVERIATAWAQLMDRLGYDRYAAQGGDWGSMITSALGTGMPESVIGIHITLPLAQRPPDGAVPPLTKAEEAALTDRRYFETHRAGYSAIQATRPQTLGYGLLDSPVAQCMWIVEKFWDWTDSAGPPENVIPRDRMLDDVMLYWLTGTAASSARLYWESYKRRRLDPVEVPTGITLFPKELWRLPRSWLARRYTDIRHFHQPDVGGHFPSMEQPEIFVDELRAFFRTLR